jgi:hypothetical protein
MHIDVHSPKLGKVFRFERNFEGLRISGSRSRRAIGDGKSVS